MRLPIIDWGIINTEVLEQHRKELQYKYLSAYTNINNIKAMLWDIKRDIKNEVWDMKSLDIALDEQNNQLTANIKASKLHKKNIIFLNDILWA